MPLNIADAQDSFLKGQASFEEWLEKFMADWYAPAGAAVLGMWWNNLSEEDKEMMRAIAPDDFTKVEDQMKQMFGS